MGAIITWGGMMVRKIIMVCMNPGNIIHEAGTVRMGSDPKHSA